jgi:putative glutamine amidotransferase
MDAMTKDRPLIGINCDLRLPTKGNVPFSALLAGYYDAILASGGLPIMLPPLTKTDDLNPILDKIDGLVLCGGGDDMNPSRQNQPFHQSVRVMPERREAADRLLCKLAEARRIPTLAIGLGMQEMNVVHGGSLYVHLPEEMPKCIPHRDQHGGVHRHVVVMEPGTKMEEIYGQGEILVNSYHHQGVRKLAPMFRPSAFAPDGVLEAYEYHELGEWWMIGVQWHPENEGQITLDTQLLESFVGAAGQPTRTLKLAKAS